MSFSALMAALARAQPPAPAVQPAEPDTVEEIVVEGRRAPVSEFVKEPATCDTTPLGDTCAEALIGRRTLTVETTAASNDETVTPAEPTPTNEPTPAPPAPCPTYPICT